MRSPLLLRNVPAHDVARALRAAVPAGSLAAAEIEHDDDCPCVAAKRAPLPDCTCETVDVRVRLYSGGIER